MGLYKNTNGVLTPIAGRGKAEYGASTIRTGTVTYTGETISGYKSASAIFDTPMPNADYVIELDYNQSAGHGELSTIGQFGIWEKTTAGFTIIVPPNALTGWSLTYTAFKLYTDNEYNGLLNNQRYSTDEIDTGQTWIDGKKIYRKVYNLGGYSATSMTQIDATDLNVDSVIDMRALLDVNGQHSIISSNSYSNNCNLGYNISTKKWYVNTGATTIWNALIVEYTKTT